ncbi:MAG: DUF1624 domain-containing protein, partial [Alcaligenaceae bacterium]
GATWTFFGVLHFILFASLLGPLLIRFPWGSMAVGVVLVMLPMFYQRLFFYRPWWVLTGLSPLKPVTEDFAPLTPWLGVVMIGVFIGHLARKYDGPVLHRQVKRLSWLGHHSLVFYMTHQLVLFPIAWALSQTMG